MENATIKSSLLRLFEVELNYLISYPKFDNGNNCFVNSIIDQKQFFVIFKNKAIHQGCFYQGHETND